MDDLETEKESAEVRKEQLGNQNYNESVQTYRQLLLAAFKADPAIKFDSHSIKDVKKQKKILRTEFYNKTVTATVDDKHYLLQEILSDTSGSPVSDADFFTQFSMDYLTDQMLNDGP